jgi:hypothetical protein
VPWYATFRAHLVELGLCLAALLTGPVAWPLDALTRRRRRRAPPRGARLARWVAAGIAPLTLVLVGWLMYVLVARFADTLIYPAGAVAWVRRLILLVVPLTAGVVISAGAAWRRRYWNLAWRLHYTAMALGAVALIAVLNHWHLLGPAS